jgi:hypothetical protein
MDHPLTQRIDGPILETETNSPIIDEIDSPLTPKTASSTGPETENSRIGTLLAPRY